MKKETKRYFLIEYCGTREKTLNTMQEVQKLLEVVRLYNNRKTSKYICGNITIDEKDGKFVVIGHIYHKLADRSTISEIDNETSQLSENELIAKYSDTLKTLKGYHPDINIAYFESKDKDKFEETHYEKRIKYIPILYKEDTQYLSEEYIKKCLKYHADQLDFDFFKSLANEFCFYHVASREIEDIFDVCDKVKNQSCFGYGPYDLYYHAFRLYKKLIYERDAKGVLIRDEKGNYQISRRRQRDFGFFIKNYGLSKGKIKSPTKYNYSMKTYEKDQLETIREQLISQNNLKKSLN